MVHRGEAWTGKAENLVAGPVAHLSRSLNQPDAMLLVRYPSIEASRVPPSWSAVLRNAAHNRPACGHPSPENIVRGSVIGLPAPDRRLGLFPFLMG